MALTKDDININDIAAMLGLPKTKYDLLSIRDCGKFNPWAKYKPINYNLEARPEIVGDPTDPSKTYYEEAMKDLTPAQRSAVNYGVRAPGFYNTVGDFSVPMSGNMTWNKSEGYPKWGVYAPTDKQRGVMRLRDFIGYEHEGAPNFIVSADSFYEGSTTRTGVWYQSANSDYIIELSDLTAYNTTLDKWYLWYIFYQLDGNGNYEPKFACSTGLQIKDCYYQNDKHPEINDSNKYLVKGQSYTMLACASPTNVPSGKNTETIYPIDQMSSSIVPLTLSSDNAMITFTVQGTSTPSTPEDEAKKMCIIGENNYDNTNGQTDMIFNTSSYPTITWTNPRVSIDWGGDSHRNMFQLTLMSNNTAVSSPWTSEFEYLGQRVYIETNEMGGTPTFRNCTTTNITGVKFEVYYDGDYREVQVVKAKTK